MDPKTQNDVSRKHVLIVEDSLALAAVYREAVSTLDLEISVAETLAQARQAIREHRPDAVLLDLILPDGNGMELMKTAAAEEDPLLFIVMTANGSVKSAVDAMREGAYDFLVKPFQPERLVVTLRNALETKVLRTTIKSIKKETNREGLDKIIGSSIPMQGVYRHIKAAAPTDASVMITGETGTGKELAAEAIHKESKRRRKPYVVLNCAAIPKDLLESELFGHLKGAFTGATSSREGAAHEADGGTLFLDELGEMDISLQSKLLRFIQQGTFQRVGSSKTEHVSVRFVAATNRDPLIEIAEGRFREDLYYRLNVVPIALPPLRDRGDDILKIAEAFLTTFAEQDGKKARSFDKLAQAKLRDYTWPGNIRQLQNVVRNAVIFSTGNVIASGDIPENLMPRGANLQTQAPATVAAPATAQVLNFNGTTAASPQVNSSFQEAAFASPQTVPESLTQQAEGQILQIEPMHIVERKMIDLALSAFNGNVSKVATALEISPSSVYRKKSA